MSVGAVRLREEADAIRQGAIAKGEDPALVDEALALDEQRREVLGKSDSLRAERKRLSESVGASIRAGADPTGPEVAALRERSNWMGAEIEGLETRLREVEAALEDLLLRIPNPPDAGIPVGGEEASLIVRTWGDAAPRGRGRGRRPPGPAGRTGRWPRRWACWTWPPAPRSRAPASRSSGLPGRPSSVRSSTSSSISTRASTA